MSVGSNLQEMENVVTKGAAAAEPMPKLTTGIPAGQTGNWEDLGGPTPENYTNDPEGPAKLKEPGATLSQVKDVVTKGAKPAEPMKSMASPVKEEEELDDEDLLSEGEYGKEEKDGEEPVEVPHKEGKKEKGEKKEGKGHEKDEDEEGEMKKEEYDIEEDVNALLEGEELSEEFQEKARVIFETAINAKVAEIKESLQSSYEQALVEEIYNMRHAFYMSCEEALALGCVDNIIGVIHTPKSLRLNPASGSGHGHGPAVTAGWPHAAGAAAGAPPAGPALPGHPKAARLSSTQVVLQANRMPVQQ